MATERQMEKSRPAKRVSDSRVQSVLDLARRISTTLQRRDDAISHSLDRDLESAINRFSPAMPAPAEATRSELDSRGCEIWNAATSIIRGAENDQQQNEHASPAQPDRFVVLLWAFASLLIDTAYQAAPKRSKDQRQRIRCFKTVLKAAKSCLKKGELNLALKVLERCSEHASASQQDSPMIRISRSSEESEHSATLRSLVIEYHLLRFTHAWKSERLDLAEHFFHQLSPSHTSQSPALAENAIELFYEAGRAILARGHDGEAFKWLQRAVSTLDAVQGDGQTPDMLELRLSVSLSLVECCLRDRSVESMQRAQTLINDLCSLYGFGSRMTVQSMQLQIVLKHQPVPMEQMHDTIMRIVRSAILTDRSFRLIMQSIHLVKKVDIQCACDVLTHLLRDRLLRDLPDQQDFTDPAQTRLEQTIVTYILFVSSNEARTGRDQLESLARLLDLIAQHNLQVSPRSTHAAQTLMWRASGAATPEFAELWVRMLRHPLFGSTGPSNKAKIDRKAMTLAMDKRDFIEAREVFYQMSSVSKNESMTRYLSFKLALQSNDYTLAEESLQSIAKQTRDDQTFLYACVLEAQQSDMRSVAVAALQAIIDKRSSDTHLPSLLRCTARLLVGEIKSSDKVREQVMEEVVNVFESASGNPHVMEKAAGERWRDEVQWWSKNAYNLSLEHSADMKSEHLARLLEVCIKFIDAYADGTGDTDYAGMTRRKVLCHLLSATAHVSLARSLPEGTEDGLQNYLKARQQITAFKSAYSRIAGESQTELKQKFFELLKFDLECIVHLQQWDQLNSALQTCLECNDVDRWDTLADIVLIIRQHPDISAGKADADASMNKLLDRIINETWQTDKNITKASRWLRLSFSMDVKDGRGEFALQLLQQAGNMAKKGYGKDAASMYPEAELQWLATTAFNKSIDSLSFGEIDGAERWMTGALELARYAADNGALHANLTDRKAQAMHRWRQMQK